MFSVTKRTVYLALAAFILIAPPACLGWKWGLRMSLYFIAIPFIEVALDRVYGKSRFTSLVALLTRAVGIWWLSMAFYVRIGLPPILADALALALGFGLVVVAYPAGKLMGWFD